MTTFKSMASLALAVLLLAFNGAAQARFVSVDPVKADANNVQNFSRYNYANNSPYGFTDPDGRQSRGFNWENQRLGVKPPPRSPDDKLGPAIGIALTGVLAAPVAAEIGLAALARPAAIATTMEVFGGAAGVTGISSGLAPRAQTTALVAADRTAQAISSVLRPNGQLIGSVANGATSEIRTVSPATFVGVRQSLSNLGAIESGGNASYRGVWRTLPNGQGGFGVRNASSGPTLDLSILGYPKGLKIHQGE